ncbi:hypothetical protein BD311DRAFT_133475 [Dichomitus squalens]|uniref:Uncharacterized protein n=1 Tax=Dichomitus squalens TaxID=114155 RepID=A0A4V2K136_9APHY|nr:hypothetical protein BD311DRAFT_133475 [Dichomitus squalens]
MVAGGCGRRANAFPVKSPVRDGRLGLYCRVGAAHCKVEPRTTCIGTWEDVAEPSLSSEVRVTEHCCVLVNAQIREHSTKATSRLSISLGGRYTLTCESSVLRNECGEHTRIK